MFESINLSIKTNKTLEVSVTERKALYTWCGATPPTVANASNQKCYFVDENGYIFDVAPYFSGEIYFKFYGPLAQTGLPDTLTQNEADMDPSGFYFSKQYFKQLASFKDILVGLGLKPVSLYVTGNGDAQVFLSSGTSLADGPKIMLRLIADNFQSVAENLETALTTEPLQSEFANKYSSLQYIDLRFGNKVYYKFANSSGK